MVMRPEPPFAGVAGPLVIAHRGGSLEAPENTVASIKHGVAAGADWQELDVSLSADGAVIVMHDDTVDRTTGGHGRIDGMTLAELRALSPGRPRWSEHGKETLARFGIAPPSFGERFASERVPTLDDILGVPDGRLMIELKKSSRAAELVDKVMTAVHRASAADRVAIASFETELLDLAYRRDPSIPLVGIVEEEGAIDDKLLLPIRALAVNMDLVEAAREKAPPALGLWAWTAYSVPMAEAAFERGAHGVITDVPEAVIQAFRAAQPAVLHPSP